MPNKSIISSLLASAQKQLIDAGVDSSPKIDSEILMAQAIQKNRSYLYTWPEKELTSPQLKQFYSLLSARISGKPIAYILGKKEFWGLEFTVNKHTLIPRADTETLVAEAINLLQNHFRGGGKILDLGTGSGAIICAIKHDLPNTNAFAVDFDVKTLEVAKSNALSLGLDIEFIHSNWLESFKTQNTLFDLIVSNPPYIEEQDKHLAQGDLRFEPKAALSSGADGLQDITIIAQQAVNHLTKNGWLLIEHGYQQAKQVQFLLSKNGFQQIKTITDYAGNDRVTLGEMPK